MKNIFVLLKRFIITVICVALLLSITACIYMQHPKFGRLPSGEELKRIERSPNFKTGKFQNSTATPTFAKGYGFWSEVGKTIFKKYPRKRPVDSIPSIRTDLRKLPADSNVLVWMGHSSCFIQIDGKRILIDPVFSNNASPIPGSVKAFKGTGIYTVDSMPEIDYLLISHDHYDHLDYETATGLKGKVKHVVCGLGTGAHFKRWGYADAQVIEADWHQEAVSMDGFKIYTEEARHKSGRGLKQNQALWVSFVIQSSGYNIFYSGDGGYDAHFDAIGKKYGPFDLALMECGQYDSAWHYVHLLPEEIAKASMDLNTKKLLPVHNSKFALANHPWDEPLVKITALSAGKPYQLITPMIGETVLLSDTTQQFQQWWKHLK